MPDAEFEKLVPTVSADDLTPPLFETPHTLKSKRILDLNHLEARQFLKKKESYANFDLPKYFDFTELLTIASGLTYKKNLKELCKTKGTEVDWPKHHEGVNYVVLGNKDGAFAWRPLELINPILYMDLVNLMTEEENWKHILKRFAAFEKSCVKCISIPRVALSDESDKASQIKNWWEEIEQRSIKLAMLYSYVFSTDITNCYASIYTHSIEWALTDGGRAAVKSAMSGGTRGTSGKSIGCKIDEKIRNMNYGQTNGIPQGSVLMDFISEIVLGYADLELTKALETIEDRDFHILRYRDDYRIFVNNPVTGYRILKELNGVLYDLGMKMNPGKTAGSDDVIISSLKKEKLEVISISPAWQHPQKEALRIYQLSKKYPNAGLIRKELNAYFEMVLRLKPKHDEKIDFEVLISIFSMIAVSSPGTISLIAAIVSQLFLKFKDESLVKRLVDDIHLKFKNIPNTGFVEIWLQRISAVLGIEIVYNDKLTEAALLNLKMSQLWNFNWLVEDATKALNGMNISNLPDEIREKRIFPAISREEVALFRPAYD